MNINIFGDFVPINRGVSSVLNGTAIDAAILSHIREADLSVVNLECPVVSNCGAKGILKDGPCLKTSEDSVKYLKNCGFDMVTLANNHLNDFGSEGVHDTFAACKKNDIMWVGAGMNLKEARIPQIIDADGFKIGIINICENESSIATEKEPGANPIDEICNYYDIIQLKSQVDRIILILHGGVEHYRLPSPRMKKLCHYYADLGVSAIVCHHTHCLSGYEVYHNVPIFYSLGNFFFDRGMRSRQWHTGYFVQLQLNTVNTTFKVYPYIQCEAEPTVKLMGRDELFEFEQTINGLNEIIGDDLLLGEHYQEWLQKRYRYYISATQTWATWWYKGAYRRSLVPSMISRKNAMQLLNYIRCESHHDLLKSALEKFVHHG